MSKDNDKSPNRNLGSFLNNETIWTFCVSLSNWL